MDRQFETDYFFPTWLIILCFVIWLIQIIGQWKVFTKAGQPGWGCIIPILNFYFMTKIGGKPGWWTLLLFIPGVNIVIAIWVINMISKSFGKDEGFTAGLIFLPFIFWPILGFGDSKYQGPFGDKNKDNNKFDFDNRG